MNLKHIFLLILFGINLQMFAQNPVTSQVDSTQIKIGSAFNLTIKANANENDKVVFPEQKMIGPFEVLEVTPIDTILNDRKMELIKKYTLTQFDSGKYTVPRLSVLINGKNFQTDLFDVEVTNVAVDTLKQPMYDIKANLGGSTDTSKIVYYFIALLLALGFGFLTYYIIKKRQEKNLTEDDLFKTPLEKITKQLQLLDGKRLIMNGDVKTYYSEMTDITRDYIEEVFDIPAKESTTAELIFHLQKTIKEKKIKLSKEIVHDLKRLLQNADLVKFAKADPQMSEIESDRKVTENISLSIDKALPRFAEEQSLRVKLREQRFRKRKQIRTWIPIAVSAFLILVTGSVYLYNSVMEGMQINWFQTNKSLYEKENWVTSDYGLPGIKLSTPEVLTRVGNTSEKTENLQTNTATFVYANLKTDLTITVNTTAMKTDENTKPEDLLAAKLQLLEKSMGAKNIKSEQESFNQDGINGVRGVGTFSILNPVTNKEQNLQFETYIFVQSNGIQEVTILSQLGDEYGTKIARRVIESIQLSINNE